MSMKRGSVHPPSVNIWILRFKINGYMGDVLINSVERYAI